MSNSILSHEERAIATMLAEGHERADIAEERDASLETVEKSIDRIREKTARAVTTLAESPFTTEVVAELDEQTRETLLEVFGR